MHAYKCVSERNGMMEFETILFYYNSISINFFSYQFLIANKNFFNL